MRLWAQARAFVERHAFAVAIVIMVAVGAGTVAGIRYESIEREQAVAAEAVQRAAALEIQAAEARHQICDEARNIRALTSELIDVAVGDGNGSLPLTSVPAYRRAPGWFQDWVQQIIAPQPNDTARSSAERLRDFQENRLGTLPEFCTQGAS